jgi:hypothetical protein
VDGAPRWHGNDEGRPMLGGLCRTGSAVRPRSPDWGCTSDVVWIPIDPIATLPSGLSGRRGAAGPRTRQRQAPLRDPWPVG